jgi:23S rRNA (guanosine2251-2'-O)-methyltransferase
VRRPPRSATADIELVAEGEELVAGRRPVEEAFAAGRAAKRLLVVPERRAALEQIVLHATTLRLPVAEVEGGTLTMMTGFDGHQGVALVVEPRRWASLGDVLERAAVRGRPPLVLILDSLEDPQNVGTLLRSADACGVDGVLFPTRRQAPLTPSAIKASAGASEHLLLCPVDDLPGALVDLRAQGMRVIAADEGASLSYRDADLRGPLGLVVGSEGHGVSGPVRRRVDLTVRIPMVGEVASLNAAVAGSVLLFEAAGQRNREVGPANIAAGAPETAAEERAAWPEPADRPHEATREAQPEAADELLSGEPPRPEPA